MGRRLLTGDAAVPGAAQRGFTLVEVMVALSMTIVVLLANIYLIRVSHKDLALARSLTEATNLATSRIAYLKTRVISTQPCKDAGTATFNNALINFAFSGNGSPCGSGDINADYPGLENEPFCSTPESQNPAYPLLATGQPAALPLCGTAEHPGTRNPNFVSAATALGRTQSDTVSVNGIALTRTWVVSRVDSNNDGTIDLVGDVVKLVVVVAWQDAVLKPHSVKIATFTTGRAP